MARPVGEPTRMVRVYVADADRFNLLRLAGESQAEAFRRVLDRDAQQLRGPLRVPAPPLEPDDDGRCHCKPPTLSKVVTNLCTACGRMR